MLTWKRRRRISKIAIHTNEGPEGDTGAEGLARYLQRIQGGYHQIHDNNSSVVTAPDYMCVAGAKGGDFNEISLHHCLIGYASQSYEQWMDNFSVAVLARCARAVAQDCYDHALSPRKLRLAEVANPGVSGIVGHADVTAAYGVRGGHTDPGAHFPWLYFMDLVRQAFNQLSPTLTRGGEDEVKPTSVVDGFVAPNGGAVTLQADGGVFDWSKSAFHGSLPGVGVKPVMGLNHAVSILPTKDFGGYWILTYDGGVFAFGNAPFRGNAVGLASFASYAVELVPNGGDSYGIVWACEVVPNGGVILK